MKMSTDGVSPYDLIRNVLGRYSRAVDDRDFDTVGACFTEDAVASYSGLDDLNGRSEIVKHISGVSRTAMSQHFLMPIIVEVDGDDAESLCYGLAVLIQKSDDEERSVGRGLRYADKWRHTSEGWQIRERRHSADWTWDLPVLMRPGAMWQLDPDSDSEATIYRSVR
jgi:ketosteroid isomerase-like protein